MNDSPPFGSYRIFGYPKIRYDPKGGESFILASPQFLHTPNPSEVVLVADTAWAL